jgi:hypothetical protein
MYTIYFIYIYNIYVYVYVCIHETTLATNLDILGYIYNDSNTHTLIIHTYILYYNVASYIFPSYLLAEHHHLAIYLSTSWGCLCWLRLKACVGNDLFWDDCVVLYVSLFLASVPGVMTWHDSLHHHHLWPIYMGYRYILRYMYEHIDSYLYTYMHAYTQIFICIQYINALAHIHIHIHIYIYRYIYTAWIPH